MVTIQLFARCGLLFRCLAHLFHAPKNGHNNPPQKKRPEPKARAAVVLDFRFLRRNLIPLIDLVAVFRESVSRTAWPPVGVVRHCRTNGPAGFGPHPPRQARLRGENEAHARNGACRERSECPRRADFGYRDFCAWLFAGLFGLAVGRFAAIRG